MNMNYEYQVNTLLDLEFRDGPPYQECVDLSKTLIDRLKNRGVEVEFIGVGCQNGVNIVPICDIEQFEFDVNDNDGVYIHVSFHDGSKHIVERVHSVDEALGYLGENT